MTSEELKEEIDLAITTETTPSSITPTDVGDTLKLMVDYVDQEINTIVPEFLTYRALITKSGTGGSAVFTLNVFQNELGKTLITSNSGTNCVILEDSSENFMTDNTFIRVTDMNYLSTVLVKFSKDSNNQITIFSYFNGSENINFTDNIQLEILVYN